MPLLPYLQRVVSRENLSASDAREAMLAILTGDSSTAQIAAFLVALRMKGETSDELLGFARAIRESVARVDPGLNGERLLDTCGTGGGDGPATFNISTIAALVVAGAGVRVAKHGNRSFSSACGSADLLEELGVNCGLDAEHCGRAIREIGIGFLFAPMLHPAVKHAQPARQELRMRTVFNLLGPLVNPAGASTQLIGASSPAAAELMARALTGLAPERAFVVHGKDGLDEVTSTGPTLVFEIQGDRLTQHEWTPADFGLETAPGEALTGGNRAMNAAIANAVLEGERGPRRDIVLMNAAAALVVSGKAGSLVDGMRLAVESIDSGAAMQKLQSLRSHSWDTL
ncbi:MAG: anthranilate phosphoribosyltransferase [Acidobacteriota bacterium]|nr:anthranilate phosphoribosyltransferase [Acidobacteriota bacterium]